MRRRQLTHKEVLEMTDLMEAAREGRLDHVIGRATPPPEATGYSHDQLLDSMLGIRRPRISGSPELLTALLEGPTHS